MTQALKLIAMDGEDLPILSAHLQDAILRPHEMVYDRAKKQLTFPVRRFVHEDPASRRWLFARRERRMSVLHIERVLRISAQGLALPAKEDVQPLVLLSMVFHRDQEGVPCGDIELVFAGDVRLRLSVECIEMQLTDTDARWQASGRPKHGSP